MGSQVPAPTFGHAAEAFILAHALPCPAPGRRAPRSSTARPSPPSPPGSPRRPRATSRCSARRAGPPRSRRRSPRRSGHWRPATRARHLAALRSAIAWWARTGWVAGDPTSGWARPKITPDTTRALTRAQVGAIWALKAPLRDKTLWRMLYETAARADEILSLDIPDLDQPGKRGRVTSKGGSTDWVHWQTGTALLLPRLLAGRTAGPVFLTLANPLARSPPSTCARSPAGPGCPTAAPRKPSSWPPVSLLTRAQPPATLSSCMAGRFTSSAIPCSLPVCPSRSYAAASATPRPRPRALLAEGTVHRW